MEVFQDSIATTRDFFKDCILACKIRNQIHTNFEKRKVPLELVVILLKNGCSVRHMFCTIFVSFSLKKVLDKHVRSSLYFVV